MLKISFAGKLFASGDTSAEEDTVLIVSAVAIKSPNERPQYSETTGSVHVQTDRAEHVGGRTDVYDAESAGTKIKHVWGTVLLSPVTYKRCENVHQTSHRHCESL